MDLNRVKPEILKKFSENKIFLSKLDFWSYIDKTNFFSFKTSQVGFQYIQGNSDLDIIDQHVSSGRLALSLAIEPIKLDDFFIEGIEIIQDIEVLQNEVFFVSAQYELKPEFSTKNPMHTKKVDIFDIRCQNNKLLIRIETVPGEFIELNRSLG